MSAGQLQLGFCLLYPAPGILEAVHRDWDWFWLDGQHGQLHYDTLLYCVRAADAVETPSIVRVPDHAYGSIGPILDMNVAGIIVPMVNTAEQAQKVVNAAKFPPIGQRSYGGCRPVDLCGADYCVEANEQSLLIVQIETAEAAANVEAIVAVPGVDGILLGPADLRLSLGLSIETPLNDPAIAGHMQHAAEATRAAGKIPGAFGGTTVEATVFVAEMGYTLLAPASDAGLIGSHSSAFATELRDALAQTPCPDTQL